jgi:2-succinyl-6-hydroxy-2,4-cyclohexadiene-1-carboxylate synthase
MTIRIRGILYHFSIHQDDPALPFVVLLHGFMGSGKSFEHLIPDLKSFCNPVTIDLLGHGGTEGAELHYRFSTKEQVADVTKLISEQLHLPLFLYGYSMGGRLALQLALHRADLFRGLILESATFGIEDETERQARQALDARRSDAIMGSFDGFLQDWKNLPLFESSTAPEALIAEIEKVQASQNPFWLANSLQGFGTGTMPCVRKKLGRLSLPVRLIVGEKDPKFLHINRQMEKEIPDARLTVVKKAGHRVHLERPTNTVAAINAFINTKG